MVARGEGTEGGVVESLSRRRSEQHGDGNRIATSVSDYLISVSWGLLWRYGLLLTAIIVKESGYHPPLLQVAIFAGIALGGAIVGVWRSRSRFAAIWRIATLSVLVVFVAPGVPQVYPYVVVLAVAVATLEPFLAARKRRRMGPSRYETDDWRTTTDDQAPPSPLPEQQQAVPPAVFPTIYSNDGRFLWNGAAWVELPPPAAPLVMAYEPVVARPRRRRRSR